jgi:hypothetical protein
MFKTLRALRFLFVGPFVLVLLVVINLMTSPGHWWVKWPALGIGIAWVISLLRVIRALVVLGGLAALIALVPWMRDRAQAGRTGRDRGRD